MILVHFLEIWCRNGCRMGLRFWHFCDLFTYFFLGLFSSFGSMLGAGLPPSGGTPLQSTNNRVFEACKPRCLRRGLRRSGLLQPRRFLQETAAGSTSPPASSGRGGWGLRSKVVSRSRFSTLVCCLAFFLRAKSRYSAYRNTPKKVRNTGRSSRQFFFMFRSYKLFPYSA